MPRQAVLSGAINAQGFADYARVGSGLTVDLKATPIALQVSFAAGLVDSVAGKSADTAAFWGGLAAHSHYYLAVDRNGTDLDAFKTTIRPQAGPVFMPNDRCLLQMDGALSDDWGNAWTMGSGASFSAGVKKFGTHSLRLDGSANGWAKTTDIWNFGVGPWCVEMFVQLDDVANKSIFHVGKTFGLYLGTHNDGKLGLWISEGGPDTAYVTGWNIASGATSATQLIANQMYHIAVQFNGAQYVVLLDGVPQITVSSTVVALLYGEAFALGYQIGVGRYTAGYWDAVRLTPGLRYDATGFTPPASAPSVDGDWFDTANMMMKMASGAGPTWTPVERCYVAQAKTGASAVSKVYSYTIQNGYGGADNARHLFASTLSASKWRAGRFVGYVHEWTFEDPRGAPFYQHWRTFANLGGAVDFMRAYVFDWDEVPPDATAFYVQPGYHRAKINGNNYQDSTCNLQLPLGLNRNYAQMTGAGAEYFGMGTAEQSPPSAVDRQAKTERGAGPIRVPVINGVPAVCMGLGGITAPKGSHSEADDITAYLIGYDLPA